jgi:hypothetical protein
MTVLKTKGVTIDTIKLKDDLQQISLDARERAADLAGELLQAQIDAINAASALRRQQAGPRVSSGTVDFPLRGARVVVRRSGAKSTKFVAFVDHRNANGVNLFNIISEGRKKPIQVEQRISVPVYEGRTVPPDLSAAQKANPEIVKNAIRRGRVKIVKRNGRPLIINLRPGDIIRPFKGAKLYDAVASYVFRIMAGEGIVNRKRRSRYRLKKDVQQVRARSGQGQS